MASKTNGDYVPDAVSSAAYGYETDDSSSSATKEVEKVASEKMKKSSTPASATNATICQGGCLGWKGRAS